MDLTPSINSRNLFWDCVKGFAIISVILGHGYAVLHDFVYSYHMALFFFVSGWFYSEKKYGDNPELNFAARIRSNWPKYVIYSWILIFIHLVIQRALGIQMVKEFFSFGSAFIYCIESTVFVLNDYLAGSMWFVPQVIFSSSLFGLIVWLARRLFFRKKDLIIIILSVVFGFIGCTLSTKEISVAGGYNLQLTMKVIPIYSAAYYSRKALDDRNMSIQQILHLPLVILFLCLILIGCYFHLDMGIDSPYYSFYFFGLAGIYIILYLSKLISLNKSLVKMLALIGRYSFEIMAFNVVIFFIINHFISLFDNIPLMPFSLNYYQQLWYIQIPLLIAIPCFIGKCYDKIRSFLIR